MVKRRKVGNLLGLAVLSTVLQRPMHPYEMASVLRARGKDQDMKIKWGSLYTVVQNLDKHGLLKATGSTRQGGRPERTVYEITDAGRAELVDWVRELVSTPEPEHPRFAAALSVLAVLGPDDAAALLDQRLARLEVEITASRGAFVRNRAEIPRLFLIEVEYDLAMREAEAAWVRALLREFADGSFPGLTAWRDWRTTGEIPPGLAELAERGSTPD
jgi:DNA-binding PadR family transcriptional regulator